MNTAHEAEFNIIVITLSLRQQGVCVAIATKTGINSRPFPHNVFNDWQGPSSIRIRRSFSGKRCHQRELITGYNRVSTGIASYSGFWCSCYTDPLPASGYCPSSSQ
jgi:hypothetical protein